ncbi:hypothetical protein Zmor_022984 [Zophobas morio]|uniref:Uncharacterized protein n=1 Tax=Zophobas morio TaxID=2755281 RepID=A0AA38HXB4_9CUCU|nr:hypothetical protein Zmor_022984 [Zophobas morio]
MKRHLIHNHTQEKSYKETLYWLSMPFLKYLFWKHSLFHILFTTLLVCFQTIDVKCLIKYEVNTPECGTLIQNEEVITTQVDSAYINILSDITVLRKGMLELAEETYTFKLADHNLEKIEIGAFDNQNITGIIDLDGNKLTVVASGTFKNLKIAILVLSYNEITHIEENAITDMPNLTVVHLHRNKIVKFHDNSFFNTPKIWFFDIQYNELSELDEKWFSFMEKEEALVLQLGWSNIEIHPRTFDGISIRSLDLSYNKLNEYPGEIFTESLTELLLNNNTLEDLPDAFFHLKNLTALDISGNSLKCGTLQTLKKFAEENSLFIKYDNQNC